MTEAKQPVPELEPCPLCGSTNLFLRDIAGWELDCRDCELSLVLADDPSRDGLIARWNTRATQSPEPPSADAEAVANQLVRKSAKYIGPVSGDNRLKFEAWLPDLVNAIVAALTTAQAKQREVDAGILDARARQCRQDAEGNLARETWIDRAVEAEDLAAAIRAGGKQ